MAVMCVLRSTPRSLDQHYGRPSFPLPNGMVVFDYSFYNKNKLWLKYYRRGRSFEIDTDRPSSLRLYGIMLRSIASRGGGPGSRWTYLHAYGRSWKASTQQGSAQSQGYQQLIYSMTDLHYDDPLGHDDIYNIDDSDDIYIMTDFPVSQTAPTHSVQGGYQDQRALRRTSRGYRSESSYLRRLSSRKSKQQEARRDFRQWKSRCKDSSLRTHGDQNPNPLICPKPAAQHRFISQSRRFPQGYNQLRHVEKPAAVPVPTGFPLQLATWNVEGLRETAKYDQILSFLTSKQLHLLAVQETKCESVSTFCKSGWEILHSGASNAKHHAVGFLVSPSLRLHAYHFLAHSPRICEITIRTNSHPVTVFSIYAPSTVEDSTEDQARKEHFWAQLDSIMSEHSNSHLIILGITTPDSIPPLTQIKTTSAPMSGAKGKVFQIQIGTTLSF